MTWREGQIDGVLIRPLARHEDARGWLAELFRSDELSSALLPAMGYISITSPGVARGPHEHREQTDYFVFAGPGDFLVRLWDARSGSATHGVVQTATAGGSAQSLMIVPPGVIHGYRNVSECDGVVLNFPNRLYAGEGKREPVDEIRHEDNADRDFSLED